MSSGRPETVAGRAGDPCASFSPEAERQLLKLYSYIADAKSASVAEGYVSTIVEFCQGLGSFRIEGPRATTSGLG